MTTERAGTTGFSSFSSFSMCSPPLEGRGLTGHDVDRLGVAELVYLRLEVDRRVLPVDGDAAQAGALQAQEVGEEYGRSNFAT